MKGYILKDWYSLKNDHKIILVIMFFFVFYFISSLNSKDMNNRLTAFILILTMMISNIVGTTIFSDKTTNFQRFSHILPHPKYMIGKAKYALFMLSAVITALISTILLGLFLFFTGHFSLSEIIFTFCMAIFTSFFIGAIQLPLNYFVDASKARVLFFTIFFGIGAIGALMGILRNKFLPNTPNVPINQSSEFFTSIYGILSISLTLLIFGIICMGISYLFFKRKIVKIEY